MILRAQAAWAAEHLDGLDPDDVKRIDFDYEDAHWWSEYTYEDGGTYCRVTLNDNTQRSFQVFDVNAAIRECMEKLLRFS